MTVFQVTYRVKLGQRPDQVKDYNRGLYINKPLAEDCIKRLIGEDAVKDPDPWFNDYWSSPKHPNVECIISEEVVHDA
jgi:hypothetical protein